MSDYEVAMRNALMSIYPQVPRLACWFHFTQAVKKKAKKFPDLTKVLKKDARLRKVFYKLLALPLLPANHIEACFQVIKSEFADTPSAKELLEYFQRQWLVKEGAEQISVFNLSTRTTASLESHNGILGKWLIKRGGFYNFVKFLLSHEYTKSREFAQLIESGGLTAPLKRRKYRVSE